MADTKKDEDTAEAKDLSKTEEEQSKLQENVAAFEAENPEKLRGAQAAASAAGIANQKRRITEIGERQANISVGNDPETGKPVENGDYAGQIASSENYSVVTSEHLGRQVLEIRPAGWVGVGFEIPATRVKEVQALLGKVKNLPKQDGDSSKK